MNPKEKALVPVSMKHLLWKHYQRKYQMNWDAEWRVLHPFDLSGVRFPTDTTPANQRRLAENDALVELIQTTEYLDDVPAWGQQGL